MYTCPHLMFYPTFEFDKRNTPSRELRVRCTTQAHDEHFEPGDILTFGDSPWRAQYKPSEAVKVLMALPYEELMAVTSREALAKGYRVR